LGDALGDTAGDALSTGFPTAKLLMLLG
jgi:hypothetical protein